ncbi:MAG: hypothetical protein ACFE85_18770 [Candidatus Hodarchaeota archaeon]
MDKQRILKEAQKIAAKFSFWMVSGNIAHLYGYAYETPDKKYEVEIKFDENFPNNPPKVLFHDEIKELLGDIVLDSIEQWTSKSRVVDIVHELKAKIQQALQIPQKIEEQPLIPISESYEDSNKIEEIMVPKPEQVGGPSQKNEEYITPDLNAYPPDFDYEQFTVSTEELDETVYPDSSFEEAKSEELSSDYIEPVDTEIPAQEDLFDVQDELSLAIKTELGLIQQEYAYDQEGENKADITIYITITVSKTFMIHVNFQNYPEKPLISFPEDIKNLLGDPIQSLESLRKWSNKNPSHIVEVIRELENKLYFIKEIELESKKILGEYQCDISPYDITNLSVHLVTFGFKEYSLEVNLGSYPKPPIIELSSDLQQLIRIPITELHAYKGWKEKESESVEIIREIAWLVDKNSRISFEIELLKEHYKNIEYNPAEGSMKVEMKGKMKTQDLTFLFQIDLPTEYPMKMPSIKILNEFELEAHEKIKNDLQSSFKDFFGEWSPFSYLVDLFNLISKKIFEVSVVSCVICHKIDCPTCSLKIAGSDGDTCHIDCPYCERSYHKHCWEQTIKSFGKCGFCLKTPPPNLMPH